VRGAAGSGGHPSGSGFDASGGLEFIPTGVWRQESPRLTPAQRRVLAELARGDSLTIDQTGEVRLRQSGAPVAPRVAELLFQRLWATRPLGELPLLGEPPIDGVITDCGRAAFIRGRKP
jgi:hypothetical protein